VQWFIDRVRPLAAVLSLAGAVKPEAAFPSSAFYHVALWEGGDSLRVVNFGGRSSVLNTVRCFLLAAPHSNRC